MTATILVVDDIPANVRLLEARLKAEYFNVKTADNGGDALKICATGTIDAVLLDVMMPGMDGFEVCERLKGNSATADIPVVMVTALDQTADRVRGLQCGADDFLTKPVNDMQLIARVKSLARLKALTDELRNRAVSASSMASAGEMSPQLNMQLPRFLVIDDNSGAAERTARTLRQLGEAEVAPDPQEAIVRVADAQPDCVLVSTGLRNFDALRICNQLRALERTRSVPVLLMADEGDTERVSNALDIGVNDYILRPCDDQELLARVTTQLRRKRMTDRLRSMVQTSGDHPVTDPLTGLSSRQFLDNHLPMLVARAKARRQSLAVLIAEIADFESLTEERGFEAGDAILVECAKRIRRCIRHVDLVCRYGGAEFVVLMPGTDLATAETVAARIRSEIGGDAMHLPDGSLVRVAVSAGVSASGEFDKGSDSVLLRAGDALTDAKADSETGIAVRAA